MVFSIVIVSDVEWRIGEDQIGAAVGQLGEHLEAVAGDDLVFVAGRLWHVPILAPCV